MTKKADKPTKPLVGLKEEISSILENNSLRIEEIIQKLNQLHQEVSENPSNFSELKSAETLIDNAIEDVFISELRKLNAIREQNLEIVDLGDIDKLKDGFALLFKLIDRTLDWNSGNKTSLEGVIHRASLRAMLIDPAVSIKTKQEIIDNWEDFM